MDSHDVAAGSALDMLAAKHVCVVNENLALAQENARLAQENAMLRMQAMAPATVQDALNGPWGTTHSWDACMGHFSNLEASLPWQTSRKQKLLGGVKNTSSSSLSGTSSLGSTVGPDSATSSLDSICDDATEVQDHGAAQMVGKAAQPLTTVMMRNMPTDYTREMLITLMNAEGFHCKYDFIYLPIDFVTCLANGNAFINFISPDEAQRFQDHFNGFSRWAIESDKECEVTWSNMLQGLAAHVDRYRSSPVMHEDMPDECRPAVFSDGVRAPFPPPLKKIRAPRIRQGKAGETKKVQS